MIPGNHDITWSETDQNLAKGFHYLLREQAEREYRRFFIDTMGNEAADFLTMVKVFEEEKVVIVGLNSCRLNEKRNAGLGYIGRDQIEEVILRLRENTAYKKDEDSFFKIAVVHHHILPAVDLDFSQLDKPPAERRFSLTIDADTVLDMLLADNFSLVLHGHLHVPFCAVERRLAVTLDDPPTNNDAHIVVTASGSLCLNRNYSTRNHYQVIDIEKEIVKFYSFEVLDTGKPRRFNASVERALLTNPIIRLSLRSSEVQMSDEHSRRMEESAILAERVFQKDPFAIEFLFQSIEPSCTHSVQIKALTKVELRTIFNSVLDIWRAAQDPIQSYEVQKNINTVTFTEYVIRLMVAAYESK